MGIMWKIRAKPNHAAILSQMNKWVYRFQILCNGRERSNQHYSFPPTTQEGYDNASSECVKEEERKKRNTHFTSIAMRRLTPTTTAVKTAVPTTHIPNCSGGTYEKKSDTRKRITLTNEKEEWRDQRGIVCVEVCVC